VKHSERRMNLVERLLMIVGLLLITICTAAYVDRKLVSRLEITKFHRGKSALLETLSKDQPSASSFKIDFSFWSKNRISAYEQSLTTYVNLPMAILRIEKVKLEAPVLEGTDELTLNRGLGHIAGTGLPGEEGNIGIAGHRDGFFRVLKDVGRGDTIELLRLERKDIYIVDQIELVSPEDISVLRPRSAPSLTLVTCYPFYFIGSAPQRFIVHASRVSPNMDSSEIQREQYGIIKPRMN
jgi:sortase A